MPLTSPAVDDTQIERSNLLLFDEFLRFYFDGAAHTINGQSVPFPSARIQFQQAEPPQPLEGLSITVVWAARRYAAKFWEWNPGKRERTCELKSVWNFFVRARAAQTTGQGNSDYQVMEASDRLYFLLQNKAATKDLAAKGIMKLAPASPALLASADYATRLVMCNGVLRYVLNTQP